MAAGPFDHSCRDRQIGCEVFVIFHSTRVSREVAAGGMHVGTFLIEQPPKGGHAAAPSNDSLNIVFQNPQQALLREHSLRRFVVTQDFQGLPGVSRDMHDV